MSSCIACYTTFGQSKGGLVQVKISRYAARNTNSGYTVTGSRDR